MCVLRGLVRLGSEWSCLLWEQVIYRVHACCLWQLLLCFWACSVERCTVTQLLWLEDNSFLNKKDKSVTRSMLDEEFQNIYCSQGGCWPLAWVTVQQTPVYSMSSECSQKDTLLCFWLLMLAEAGNNRYSVSVASSAFRRKHLMLSQLLRTLIFITVVIKTLVIWESRGTVDRLKLRAGDYSSNCFSEKLNACFQTSNVALLSLESNLIRMNSLQSSDFNYSKSVILCIFPFCLQKYQNASNLAAVQLLK